MAISPPGRLRSALVREYEWIIDVLKLLFSQQTVWALQLPAEARPRSPIGVQVKPTGTLSPCTLKGMSPRSFASETWFAGWTVSQHWTGPVEQVLPVPDPGVPVWAGPPGVTPVASTVVERARLDTEVVRVVVTVTVEVGTLCVVWAAVLEAGTPIVTVTVAPGPPLPPWPLPLEEDGTTTVLVA